jgi:hypothetical protein
MRTAHTSPSGFPPSPSWAIVTAPIPAKLNCASETCPAIPTSGTNDKAMIPKANTRARSIWSEFVSQGEMA